MKVCIDCKVPKPDREYNVGRAECRRCQKIRWQEWRRQPENIVKVLVRNAQARAKKKGIEFDLKPEDLTLPETCPVIGIPIMSGGSTTPNSPSLDRIDADRGYVPDNVIIMSHMANSIKSYGTPEQIRMVADWCEKNMERYDDE